MSERGFLPLVFAAVGLLGYAYAHDARARAAGRLEDPVAMAAERAAEAKRRGDSAVQAYIDAQRAHDAVPDYAVAAGAQHAYRRMGSSPALRALAAEAQARAFDAAGTDGYAAAARHSMIVDELVRESN